MLRKELSGEIFSSWIICLPDYNKHMDENINTTDEEKIIGRVLSGEINAFEILIEKYKNFVFTIAAKRIPYQDIEEVAHEVFMRAYQSLSSYAFKKPFQHWLARIAVCCCCDYWRKNSQKKESAVSSLGESHLEWLSHISSVSSQEEFKKEALKKEAGEILELALNQLKPEDRLVLELYYFEQWSVKEISKMMNWSVPSVKIRAMRARIKLRKIIRDWGIVET